MRIFRKSRVCDKGGKSNIFIFIGVELESVWLIMLARLLIGNQLRFATKEFYLILAMKYLEIIFLLHLSKITNPDWEIGFFFFFFNIN